MAKIIVREAYASYTAGGARDVVISAIDVTRLNDLARDFDALTIAYMQALGDFIAWEAREAVARNTLGDRSSYDLWQLLFTIEEELKKRIKEPLDKWLNWILSSADSARRTDYAIALERACTRQRVAARQGQRALAASASNVIEMCVGALRRVRKQSKERSHNKLDAVVLPSGRIRRLPRPLAAVFLGPDRRPAGPPARRVRGISTGAGAGDLMSPSWPRARSGISAEARAENVILRALADDQPAGAGSTAPRALPAGRSSTGSSTPTT